MTVLRFFIALLLLVGVGGAVRADYIYFLNGNDIEGDVIDSDATTYTVQVEGGTVIFTKEDIARVVEAPWEGEPAAAPAPRSQAPEAKGPTPYESPAGFGWAYKLCCVLPQGAPQRLEGWRAKLFAGPRIICLNVFIALWTVLYGGLATKLFVRLRGKRTAYWRAVLYQALASFGGRLIFIVSLGLLTVIFAALKVSSDQLALWLGGWGLAWLIASVICIVMIFKLSRKLLGLGKLETIGMILAVIFVNIVTLLALDAPFLIQRFRAPGL